MNDVLYAVSNSGDPRLKATAFKEAAAELEAIELQCRGDDLDTMYEQGDSLKQIRDGMRDILKSDAAGTIKSLRETVDPKGDSVQTYLQALILIAESVLPLTVDEAFVEAKKDVFHRNDMDEYTPLW